METVATEKEILQKIKDLQVAMIKMINIGKAEDDIKLEKIKIQKELLMAKEEVRALQIN